MKSTIWTLTLIFLTYFGFAQSNAELLPFEISLIPIVEKLEAPPPDLTEDLLLSSNSSLDEPSDQADFFVPKFSNEIVATRLATLEKVVPLHYNEKVRRYIDYFSIQKRAYTSRILARKNLYFPLFEKKLKEHGLPDEIKYLAVVESALIYKALSRQRALGLWQFIASTARLYNLKVGYYTDERLDPEKATEAACRFLKHLYETFGDWELAMAAYNCGPGNVRKAMRRSGKTKFWDIYRYLPRETRNYIPKYVATIYVMNHAEDHNLIPSYIDYPIPTATIVIEQGFDLKKMAKALNVCYDDLSRLNPTVRYGALPAKFTPYTLKIPSKRFDFFRQNQAAILDKIKVKGSSIHGGGLYHIVRRGQTLGQIAKVYGVRTRDLMVWNNLRSSRIYPRQRLYLARHRKPQATAKRSKPIVAKNGETIHIINSGDNLWDIARRYNTSIAKIKHKNGLISNRLKIGQRLIIP